jgi:hypothetical protein
MDYRNSEGQRPRLNVFAFQQKVLPVLLGWAAGSTLAGLVWQRGREPFWQGLGEQFVGWGLVDGLIALGGIRGAGQAERRYLAGEINPQTHERQRRNFFWLLAGNTLLDVGYIWGGQRIRKQAGDRTKRLGMGWGIIFQGSFLLVWDIILMVILSKVVDEV